MPVALFFFGGEGGSGEEWAGRVFLFSYILKGKYDFFVLNNDQVICLLVQFILFGISGGMTYSSEGFKLRSSQAFILVK